jgi:hypothetical protein
LDFQHDAVECGRTISGAERGGRGYTGADGSPVAIKAMAAKLARVAYRTLRFGMQCVDQGADFYEANTAS